MAVNPDDYEQRGRYWYPKDTRVRESAREWRICEGCGKRTLILRRGRFCDHVCQAMRFPPPVRTGSDHHAWKGDDAGYVALHERVKRTRGAPDRCLFGCEASKYHWACLTGEYGDMDAYTSLCVPCHKRFDLSVLAMLRVISLRDYHFFGVSE